MLAASFNSDESEALLTVYSCHDKPDLCGVGSTCEMGVYLFGLVLIEGNEPVQDVVASRGIIRTTLVNIRYLLSFPVGSILVKLAFIIREVVLHRTNRKLLLKSIDLVQKQDD